MDILNVVQKTCQADAATLSTWVEALGRVLAEAGVEQSPVTLEGLGTFVAHKYDEYEEENPTTGQLTLYPPRILLRLQAEGRASAGVLVSLLAEEAHISTEAASRFLRALTSAILQQIEKGEAEVRGIGVFWKVVSHQGDSQHIAFTPDARLQRMVNEPFSCFEPVVVPLEKAKKVETPAAVTSQAPAAAASAAEKKEEVKPTPAAQPTPAAKADPQVLSFPEEDKEEPDEDEPERSQLGMLVWLIPVLLIVAVLFLWKRCDNEFDEYYTKGGLAQQETPVQPAPAPSEVIDLADSDDNNDEPVAAADSAVEETPVQEVVPAPAEPQDTPQEVAPQAPAQPVDVAPQPAPTQPAVAPTPAADLKAQEALEEIKQTEKRREEIASDSLWRAANGKPMTHTVEPGERLTLIALQHYGDKCFWPYIFMVNRSRLKASSLVHGGMVLQLPNPAFYHIDVNNADSRQRAKNLAAQITQEEERRAAQGM